MTLISWFDLAWCLVPVALVLAISMQWRTNSTEIVIAVARMLVQLVAVGYLLVVIFNNPSPLISAGILILMITLAGWIAVRPVRQHRQYLMPSIIALGIAVGLHLMLSLLLVLRAGNWFRPDLLIPLAGMYFANTMNTISLAAERFQSELENQQATGTARAIAFQTSMIPQINSLLAVGLVALPGMMTGQILSGVSPLVAVRYQIMIMSMLLGASGVGAALMLWIVSKNQSQ